MSMWRYLSALSACSVLWAIICIVDLQSGIKRIPAWSWGAVWGSATVAVWVSRHRHPEKALNSEALKEALHDTAAYPQVAAQVANLLLLDSSQILESQRQAAGLFAADWSQIDAILQDNNPLNQEPSHEPDADPSHPIHRSAENEQRHDDRAASPPSAAATTPPPPFILEGDDLWESNEAMAATQPQQPADRLTPAAGDISTMFSSFRP